MNLSTKKAGWRPKGRFFNFIMDIKKKDTTNASLKKLDSNRISKKKIKTKTKTKNRRNKPQINPSSYSVHCRKNGLQSWKNQGIST
jgi:hypothetical protein